MTDFSEQRLAASFAVSVRLVEMMKRYVRDLDTQWLIAANLIELDKLRRRPRGGDVDRRHGAIAPHQG